MYLSLPVHSELTGSKSLDTQYECLELLNLESVNLAVLKIFFRFFLSRCELSASTEGLFSLYLKAYYFLS